MTEHLKIKDRLAKNPTREQLLESPLSSSPPLTPGRACLAGNIPRVGVVEQQRGTPPHARGLGGVMQVSGKTRGDPKSSSMTSWNLTTI